ncbi:MAG: hypothetical protein ASARMPRED_008790 [Alectoria sarmentosa]|nr:MAG: hypothetical protein ASARMPRED_008790 [Alectoria sarmentosa]
MDTHKQPLLNYLKVKNPILVSDTCRGGENTCSIANTYLVPGRIGKWEDFDYDSLRSIYGGALHRVLTREFFCQDFSNIPLVPFCQVSDEDCLEALLIKWNQSVVSEALSVTQQHLYRSQTHEDIYMARGGQAHFPGQFRPDWAGIQKCTLDPNKNSDDKKPNNILPGDTKLGTKWSSRDIVSGPVQIEYSKVNWLRPLNQVYTYCVRSNARYGYIITDKELVVLRVRPLLEAEQSQVTNGSPASLSDFDSTQNGSPTSQSSFQATTYSQEHDEGNDSKLPSATFEQMEDGNLEYKAIPWSNARTRDPRRSEDLTVNLALWWLHIMASVSSNIKEQYQPLKDTAQPTFFGENDASFGLSEISRNTRPEMTIRSRKRSSSALSNDHTASDTSNNEYGERCGRPKRVTKRIRADDEGIEDRRRTRSMAVSAN